MRWRITLRLEGTSPAAMTEAAIKVITVVGTPVKQLLWG